MAARYILANPGSADTLGSLTITGGGRVLMNNATNNFIGNNASVSVANGAILDFSSTGTTVTNAINLALGRGPEHPRRRHHLHQRHAALVRHG